LTHTVHVLNYRSVNLVNDQLHVTRSGRR